MSTPYMPTDLAGATPSEVPEMYRARPNTALAAPASSPETPAPELAKPSTTETLRAAAAPSWPEGAPKLRPLMRLPFAERAEAMELFAAIEADWQNMPAKGSSVTTAQAAKMYRAMAKMSRYLESVAEDPVAYRAWVADKNDEDFGALFTAYLGWSSPGEADSSSS